MSIIIKDADTGQCNKLAYMSPAISVTKTCQQYPLLANSFGVADKNIKSEHMRPNIFNDANLPSGKDREDNMWKK